MARTFTIAAFTSLTLLLTLAPGAVEKAPGSDIKGEPGSLRNQLLGVWRGGPCRGSFDFHSDGTFTLTNFTPGNNRLTGTWAIRWDALPPTLLLTYRTSDFKVRDPTREEWMYLGKTAEVKLLELNRETLSLQPAGEREATRYERVDGGK